tara:strand:+ start:7907 stop:9070 length:1164 start_codon:yes stop_codon:yes gene_type:complete
MLSAAITITKLPAQATLSALKTATSPNAVNALATAISQASIRTSDAEESIAVDGLTVNIELDNERLLTTAGISTAIAMGTVYWIGSRLRIQYRYAAVIETLEALKRAIKNGDETKAILTKLDNLSNPLLDPETFRPIDAPDDVIKVYETLFNKPATSGSMFNTSAFTQSLDEIGVASKAALTKTDDALKAMISKARPVAGTVAGRLAGAVLWVDTVWWVSTSALDLGLNFLGIDEKDQKIPILSDIPFIGALFDLSDSTGSSFVDLVISPLLDGIISLFSAEDEVQVLVDALWGIITGAALNPTILPFVIAILDFYIENISVDFDVPATFDILEIGSVDYQIDLFGFRPEPLDILVVWLYLITGKIIIKAWVLPAFRMLKGSAPVQG